MRGYKAFGKNLKCRDFQYEVGKTYEFDGKPIPCVQGFHFCKSISECYNFYPINDDTRICEVNAIGDIESDDGIKYCTNKIEIVAEVTELWKKHGNTNASSEAGFCNTGNKNTGNKNTGNKNTGDCNSGNKNTGDCNSGNWNTGNKNTGDCNSGNCNTGDCNSGNCNTGDCNTGNKNTGNWNTGDCNSGNCNTGDCNTGNKNTGDCNTGNKNTGNCNTGNKNTGDCNTGNKNTGNCNTGDWNTGNGNTGDKNTGYYNTGIGNTGDKNTGYYNTGNWNTGDWNKADFETGCFNTKNSSIRLFNKESNMSYIEWANSEACSILHSMPNRVIEWIDQSDMTDEEKENNPSYKVTGGYLKTLNISDTVQFWWDSLSETKKDIIKSIPNFDPDIFYECTGIKVD